MRIWVILLTVNLVFFSFSHASFLRFSAKLLVPKSLKSKTFSIPELALPEAGLRAKDVKVDLSNGTRVSVAKAVVDVRRALEFAKLFPELKGKLKKLPIKKGNLSFYGIAFVQNKLGIRVSVNKIYLSKTDLGNYTVNDVMILMDNSTVRCAISSVESAKLTLNNLLFNQKGSGVVRVSISGVSANVDYIAFLMRKIVPDVYSRIISSIRDHIRMKAKAPTFEGVVRVNNLKVGMDNETMNLEALLNVDSFYVLDNNKKMLGLDARVTLRKMGDVVEVDSGKLLLGINNLVLDIANGTVSLAKGKLAVDNFNVKFDGNGTDLSLPVSISNLDINASLKDFADRFKVRKLSFVLSGSYPGKLNLDNVIAEILQGKDGYVKLSGSFEVPEDLRNVVFGKYNFTADLARISFKDIFLKKLSLVSKDDVSKFAFSLRLPDKSVEASGELNRKVAERSLNIYIPMIRVLNLKKSMNTLSDKGSKVAGKFDFSFLEVVPKYIAKLSLKVNEIEVQGLAPLTGLEASASFGNGTMEFSGGGDYCHVSFGFSGVAKSKSYLQVSVGLNVISSPVDSVISCFVKRAPVYLKGDLHLDADLESHGVSVKSIKETIKWKAIGTIKNGAILKLSNVDSKLKWIFDILEAVNLKKKSLLHDAITFSLVEFYLIGDARGAEVRKFFLISPQLKLVTLLYGGIRFSPKFEKCLKGSVKAYILQKNVEVCDKSYKAD